jgi:thiamine transport system permease protein
MARRAQPLGLRLTAAGAALAVALFVFGPLAAVALRAEGPARLSAADWSAVRFTLLQATLSAGLSVALAVPVARALSRRRFPGRRLLVTALGAPFLLPVIVAVLALLTVFGWNGLLNSGLAALGLPKVNIYGLQGVLLAHVFFNLPLATRLILSGWARLPAETFRLAAALDLCDRQVFRVIEAPMLRQTLPGAFVLVFLLCLTSFAVVLTLGGGPRATTIELAIYQAFRFEFDLGRAALLALVQIGLGLGAAGLALAVAPPEPGSGMDAPVRRWDGRGWRRVVDGLALTLTAAFVAVPLASVFLRGVGALPDLPQSVLWAALRSAVVALAATGITLALALPLALMVGGAGGSRASRLAEVAGTLSIAASPLVLGTGLFLILNPVVNPVALALPIAALVNALMALPFALRALIPPARETHLRFHRLAESLDLPPWARLRLVTLPRLRQPLGFALGLAAALSVGDLGVVALFTDPAQATLPLEMYRLMDAYRTDQAAAAALLLAALAFAMFWAFDRIGRDAAA